MKKFEFPSSMYPWIIMLTSSLADESLIVKFKVKMKFMIEIVNPLCNSLLATFFEFNIQTSRKRASSCVRTSVSPHRTLNHVFEPHFAFLILMPLKIKLLEREARRVLWEVQRDQMKQVMFARRRLVRRQIWRTRSLMMLVAMKRFESLATSQMDSRSQKSFV